MNEELNIDGKFEYIEKGEGQPMILLHGLFGELSNFEGILNYFSDRYRVIIPKLPLYDLPIIKTGVKTLSKYFNEFLEHIKITEPYLLLGNSLGGHIALVHSNKHPELVEKLILTGSSGLYENAFGGSFPRRGDKSFIRKKIEITFYDQEMVTDELVDQCFEIVNNRDKVIRVLALAKSAIRHNMEKELVNYKMPVCLIWGKNDEITPPHVAEEFHAKMPDADLFWIDKCGHAPMMEHPEEFNMLLDKWLSNK